MRLAIVGGRDFSDYTLMDSTIKRFFGKPSLIISGGAPGADSLAEKFALVNHIGLTVHNADWNKLGKAAGPIRNELIVKSCDFLLCFWDGASKGSQNSLSIAKRLKRPTMIIYY